LILLPPTDMDFDTRQRDDAARQPVTPARAAARQAVAGLTPPQLGEAVIREKWPAVVAVQPGLAALAQALTRTILLAPVAWLLLAPVFALKFFPFLCKRYTLTNRRLMIQRGLKPRPVQEVSLAAIDDVRFDPASYNAFYRCGTLEAVSQGKVVLTLRGVSGPEAFRHSVLDAVRAWVPEKAKGAFVPASAIK
jgi:hypothetical protein